MMKKLIKIFMVVFVFIQMHPALAENKTLPVILDNTKEIREIGRYLEIFEDITGKIVFPEISSPAFNDRFVPSHRDVPNYSMSNSAYWVRFSVIFPSYITAENEKWFLKCEWPHLTSVTAYISGTDGSYKKTESGASNIAPSREFPYNGYLFRLPDQPGKTAVIYIRIQSTGALVLPFSIISEKKLLSGIVTENTVTGLFFGIMLVMIFYHLMLFAVIRDRDYLYFAGFLASSIIFYMLNEGMFEEYVQIGGITLLTTLMSAAGAGAAAIATLFTIYMLNLKNDLPTAAKILYGFIILYVIASISSLFLPETYIWSAFFFLSLSQDFIIITIAVIRLTQRFKLAVFFLILSLFSLSSNCSYMLVRFDLIPFDLFSRNLLIFFTIAQSIVFSYVISVRIKRTEKGRIEAQSQAIENLRKAEQIKDEFLANTSHELKTPLHGIVGLSELMLSSGREKIGDSTRENLNLISASGRRLLNLVNDILDFSSMRHGSLALSVKPVKLRESVTAVFSLLEPLTDGKAVELRNSVPPDFMPLLADEARLRQILMNLAGNSLRFVPFGVIEISAIYKEEMAEISVSDTGVGINNVDLKRIFNAFEQGEGSDSRSYEGTGLGLAITRKLVDLHGGSIRVNSVPGKSTTFTFTLPLDRNIRISEGPSNIIEQYSVPDAANPAYQATETILLNQNLLEKANASILIVEDDLISRKILCETLSQMKYDVHTAKNGIEALVNLGGKKYDLLLLDVMMPGLSGYELLRRIRLKLSPEELPVILVTAKSQLDDIHAGFKAGANDYIIKPFSMDELSLRVENMLKLKKVLPPDEPGIMIREKGSIRIIRHRSIIYISSFGKRTIIHTTEHDVIASMMLKDIEIKLPGSFLRIHKQHIIHTSYLSGVTHIGSGRYEAILNDRDDTRLVVGRSFVANLREHIVKSPE